MGLKIVGKVKLQQVNKEGEVLKEGDFKNIVVETGKEFILDLLINKTDYYQGNTSIGWMACGSINVAPSKDDWKLYGEGTLNEGGAMCRVTLDPQTDRTLTTIEFHGVFTEGDFPSLPYPIGELGAFLGSRPPSSDPQSDSSQRPYAMFNRLVIDPIWIKYNDGTDLRFKYTVTLTDEE